MAAVAAVTNVLWGCSVNFSWQIPQCGVRANLCIDVVQSLAGAALAFSSCWMQARRSIYVYGDVWDFSPNQFFAEVGPNRFLKKTHFKRKTFLGMQHLLCA